MISEPRCVAPTGDRCGEGVVWHESHGAVYWTDINRFLIHRFTPADESVRSWFFDEPVTALTLTNRNDTLAVVLGSSVILWEPASDTRHKTIFKLPGWPKVRLNDARADPQGSLWLGSMRNNVNADGSSGEAGGKDGILYRLDPAGGATIHRRELAFQTLWHGVPTGVISISAIRLRIRFGCTTTILSAAASATKLLSWTASRAASLMAPQWTPTAISGTAVSMANVLCAWLPTGKLIASSRCQFET